MKNLLLAGGKKRNENNNTSYIKDSGYEIGKIVCARGDACAFTAKDGKTGKVTETHYLGSGDWERSRAIGKLRGVSVSSGCWASESSFSGSGETSARDRGVDNDEEEESSDSEDEGTAGRSYEEKYDMDDGTYGSNSNATKSLSRKKRSRIFW